jgi:hypothetical protein
MASLTEWYVTFLVLTLLILVVPVVILETAPEETAAEFKDVADRLREVIIIKILGYSEKAAEFPTLIFSILIPFGIALGVIMIFMGWMQKNMFPTVSPGIFALVSWFMAIVTTRLYGPMIAGWYAGLGIYGLVAFGGGFLISILLSTRIYKTGWRGLFVVGIVAFIFPLSSLFIFNFLGLGTFSLSVIFYISIASMVFMIIFSYFLIRRPLGAAEAVMEATQRQIRILQAQLNRLEEEFAREEDPRRLAALRRRIDNTRAKLAALEEQQRKALIA